MRSVLPPCHPPKFGTCTKLSLIRVKMYLMIKDVIVEKPIDLSDPIRSGTDGEEIAVVNMFSDNVQYEAVKPRKIIDNILGDKKLILSRTYAGKALISTLEGMIELTQFVNDD